MATDTLQSVRFYPLSILFCFHPDTKFIYLLTIRHCMFKNSSKSWKTAVINPRAVRMAGEWRFRLCEGRGLKKKASCKRLSNPLPSLAQNVERRHFWCNYYFLRITFRMAFKCKAMGSQAKPIHRVSHGLSICHQGLSFHISLLR